MTQSIFQQDLRLMEETKVVYKRNSAWWFAFCYLTGTFFLLCYGLLSLAGLVVDIGAGGMEMLKESHQEDKAQRYVAAQIKQDVTLESFHIATQDQFNNVTVSIRNASQYPIDKVKIEIAYLDASGVPVHVENVRLSGLDVIYPGEVGNASKDIPVDAQYQYNSMSVRLGEFNVVDERNLQAFCQNLPATDSN